MDLPPLNPGVQATFTVLSFTSLVDTSGGLGRTVGTSQKMCRRVSYIVSEWCYHLPHEIITLGLLLNEQEPVGTTTSSLLT